MGIFFVVLAGLLASISNFCMRRSIDSGGSSKAYLVVQLTFSLLVMILLGPVRTGDYTWSWPPVWIGLFGGVFFGLLMWGLGKSLEHGPPGLTFAALNSSTVAPAIVMTLLFGSLFGHSYSLTNGLGSSIVVLGLVWAGWTSQRNENRPIWLFYIGLIIIVHTIFLAFLQWWALILKPGLPPSALLPFHLSSEHIQWFMPAVLFTGAAFQWVVYIAKRHRLPKGSEVYFGILGGITNGACTFFLILAPQVGAAWENAMIFPIFSVSIILICNAWAQIIYSERVNWWANGLCVAGLIVGTIAWQSL